MHAAYAIAHNIKRPELASDLAAEEFDHLERQHAELAERVLPAKDRVVALTPVKAVVRLDTNITDVGA